MLDNRDATRCSRPGCRDARAARHTDCASDAVSAVTAFAAPGQFRAALARAVELGRLWRHESGTYVKFTPAGADLFA